MIFMKEQTEKITQEFLSSELGHPSLSNLFLLRAWLSTNVEGDLYNNGINSNK